MRPGWSYDGGRGSVPRSPVWFSGRAQALLGVFLLSGLLGACASNTELLVAPEDDFNDPNTFSGLAETREGAVELLGKGRIDETVADFRLVNVQPGERKTVVFSRAQTAQFVGLIVGYFRLTPGQDVHIFEIPVVASDRGLVDLALSKVGLTADEAKAKPGRLALRVDLGRAGTQQVIKLETTEQ